MIERPDNLVEAANSMFAALESTIPDDPIALTMAAHKGCAALRSLVADDAMTLRDITEWTLGINPSIPSILRELSDESGLELFLEAEREVMSAAGFATGVIDTFFAACGPLLEDAQEDSGPIDQALLDPDHLTETFRALREAACGLADELGPTTDYLPGRSRPRVGRSLRRRLDSILQGLIGVSAAMLNIWAQQNGLINEYQSVTSVALGLGVAQKAAKGPPMEMEMA